MNDFPYTSLDKSTARLGASDVEALAAGIRGGIATPQGMARTMQYAASGTAW